VKVDSFAYLPRSFRPLYEDPKVRPEERDPVWAPPGRRLGDTRVTLLTSAGLHVKGAQEPFDAARERREPTWGDPTHRTIPHAVRTQDLGATHLHIDCSDLLRDHHVALPTGVLDELGAGGVVGGATDEHLSVMGYQGWREDPLDNWREQTRPRILADLHRLGSDGVVLAPV
jgi:hypothetical protein